MNENLTHRAEQAVLGGLLSGVSPGMADELDVSDFADPQHQAIFAALIADDDPPGIIGQVRRWLARLGQLGEIREAEAYMNKLPDACPAPGHLGSYIQMLLEERQRRTAEARQRVNEASTRIEAATDWLAARTAPAPVTQPLPDNAAKLASALAPRARQMAANTVAPPERGAAPPPAEPAKMNRARMEELVLADLIARPATVAQMKEWLPADAFETPAASHLYELLVALDDAGGPVDPLIVAWEAGKLAGQAPAGSEPLHDAGYALRIGGLSAEPGTAETFARGLLAERICGVKFGPSWTSNLSLAHPDDAPAQPEPVPVTTAPIVEPQPIPPTEPPPLQRPAEIVPQAMAPVPGA
jgi:hypothetical protein